MRPQVLRVFHSSQEFNPQQENAIHFFQQGTMTPDLDVLTLIPPAFTHGK